MRGNEAIWQSMKAGERITLTDAELDSLDEFMKSHAEEDIYFRQSASARIGLSSSYVVFLTEHYFRSIHKRTPQWIRELREKVLKEK